MTQSDIVGYIATAVSVSTLFPQVAKIIKTRSTKDISLEMSVLGIAGSLLWLIFGIMTVSAPVIIANSIVCLNFLTILIFKLKFK